MKDIKGGFHMNSNEDQKDETELEEKITEEVITPNEEATPTPLQAEEPVEVMDTESSIEVAPEAVVEEIPVVEETAPVEEVKTPLEETPRKMKKKNKILLGVIAAVVVIVAALGIKLYMDEEAYQAYAKEYNGYLALVKDTQGKMLDGAALSEGLNNGLSEVWSNAIWKKDSSTTDPFTKVDGVFVDDFNTALSAYRIDGEVLQKRIDITNNQVEVDAAMKKLKTIPDGLEDHSSKINTLYDTYTEYITLALNPTGSLKTFQETTNELSTRFLVDFEKIDKLDYTEKK